MATKAVVCPECGAAAAPGRYACAECGSLLAAVAALPRVWDPELVLVRPPTEPALLAVEPAVPAEPAELDPPAVSVDGWTPHPGADTEQAWVDPDDAPLGSLVDSEPELEPAVGAAPSAAMAAAEEPAANAAAPVAAAVEPVDAEPALAPGLAESAGAEPELDPTPVQAPPSLDVAGRPADVLRPVPTPAYLQPARLQPAWPPPGATGPQPQPAGRMPAGAYLPPSAFLDALDRATAGPAQPPAVTGPAGSAPRAATTEARSRFDLSSLVARLDLAAETPRAVIAVGAAIAAIGFLLPWANVLAGAGLLGGYFTQWGLAGPGSWIVLTLLVGLVGVALAGAPTARWPVARAALALAAVLVGLVWPYLFGVLGRSIGVWVVLAGAAVLLVGSIVDRGERHDPEGPTVR